MSTKTDARKKPAKPAIKVAMEASDNPSGKSTQPSLGSQILQGLREAVSYERGKLELPAGSVRRVPLLTVRGATAAPVPHQSEKYVLRVRHRLNLSQPVFAQALNVSADTVRSWEQGKRRPDGAAARLLEIADKHPDVILSTVHERKG